MSNGGQEHDADPLLREVEKDFEALVRLIERAIEHMAISDYRSATIERLDRAKRAAEKGAKLAREAGQRNLEH